MITYILYFILSVQLVFLFGMISSLLWLRKSPESEDRSFDIVLIVPLFEEYRIVDDLFERFSRLSMDHDLSVVFVTTEKENATGNRTKRLLESKPERSAIAHVHYPRTEGNKASQVNYAVDQLSLEEDTLIGIYDADSDPDDRTFALVREAARSSNAQVFQEFPLYSQDLGSRSSFLRGAAAFQTRRTLSYEIPLLRTWWRWGRFPVPRTSIGHGLFIRADYLRNHPLPEDSVIEDIPYGYELLARDVEVWPLPVTDRCQVPRSSKALFLQSGVWFGAEWSANDTLFSRIIRGEFRVRDLAFWLVKTTDNLWWLTKTYLIIALVLIALWRGEYLLIGALVAVLFAQFIVVADSIRRFGKEPFDARDFPSYLLRLVFDSVGPVTYCMRLLRYRFTGKQAYYKTER